MFIIIAMLIVLGFLIHFARKGNTELAILCAVINTVLSFMAELWGTHLL